MGSSLTGYIFIAVLQNLVPFGGENLISLLHLEEGTVLAPEADLACETLC